MFFLLDWPVGKANVENAPFTKIFHCIICRYIYIFYSSSKYSYSEHFSCTATGDYSGIFKCLVSFLHNMNDSTRKKSLSPSGNQTRTCGTEVCYYDETFYTSILAAHRVIISLPSTSSFPFIVNNPNKPF